MGFRSYRGYSHSENGWRICDRSECVTVPGRWMDTAPIRRGVPEVILGDFARRYNDEVAPLVSPVWGFSWENSVPNSNHLSGTALDINAPQWPMGYYRMPRDLVARVNALVAWYEGAIYWGREWNTPDEMHFQIGRPEGDPLLYRVVGKILGPPAPPPYDPRTDPYVRAGFLQLIPPNRRPK